MAETIEWLESGTDQGFLSACTSNAIMQQGVIASLGGCICNFRKPERRPLSRNYFEVKDVVANLRDLLLLEFLSADMVLTFAVAEGRVTRRCNHLVCPAL